MAWLHERRLRWRAFVKRRRLDRDLAEEIRFHLDMRARQNRAAGMTALEAAYAAHRRFGNPGGWKESLRDMWSLGIIESAINDVRYAARSLRKTPGFTAAAVLVIALGIGSTTAIFSVVNAVLLRGLPFTGADQLVMLWGNVQRQKVERRGNSYPDYLDWKAQANSFEGMAACTDGWLTLTGGDDPERMPAEWVSAGYFELLGIKPIVGRTIRPDEDRVGSTAAIVLLSEGVWKRRFGSDPNIIGKKLQLNQKLFTVIGILPARFHGLTDGAAVWAPFTGSGAARDFAERGSRGFPAIARLKPGTSMRQAQTEMDGISKRLEQAYPDTNAKRGVEVAPLAQELVGALQTPLLFVLGAVACVLLIACANVASLSLARSESRKQEIAIRTALGAGRARVLRQLITESVMLSVAGAAFGLALAVWVVQVLTKASPITLPTFVDPQPDWSVAAFAVVLSLIVGVVVGILPAFQALQQDVHDALKESVARAGDAVARQRFRGALVVAEVALAMTLLVGAGLLMRSFQHLSALNPGFDPQHMLTLIAALPRGGAPIAQSSSQADALTVVSGRQLLQRLRALPSVTSASVASDVPLGADSSAIFYSPEGQAITDAQTRPRAYIHRVSPEFFATLGAPLPAGRTFTETEMDGRASVVIVTDNLVKRFWPGQDPIGKRIKSGGSDSKAPWWNIIGVVHEMKYRGLPANPTADPDIFLPFSDRQRNVAILIRSLLDPSKLTGAVRAAVREVDPSIPVYEIATMDDRVRRGIERSRFASWMMAVFAALALTLSAIGLYGLLAYTVRRRTRELGIRMAIGASPGEVAGMVVRRGMILVALGIGIGIACALGLTRVLETLLFGISPADPTTFLGVPIVLAGVALIACYLPARRASRIDPVTALRHE